MIILGINTALFIYMGDGPAWPFATGPDHNCEHYWWTNLLYINNFFGMKKQVLLCSKYLPPANEVCEGYVFTGVCLSTGGGHAWQGVGMHLGCVCVMGSMHGGGCAWQGVCMVGGHA